MLSLSIVLPFQVFDAPVQTRQSVWPDDGDTPSPTAQDSSEPWYFAVKVPVSLKLNGVPPLTFTLLKLNVMRSVSVPFEPPTQPPPEHVPAGLRVKAE